ncbi:calmodulin-A-like [Liolophura sinensis]|uniref:calmodulin-A-like n=1 Tax=Liolophura sinensis TaxID=3198878 RepID=UPI0031585B8F
MSAKNDLSKERIAEIKEAFKMFDKNGDGVISITELGTVLRALGQNPTNKNLEEMIKQADITQNGVIDFNEFTRLVSVKGLKSQEEEKEELRLAFKIFDRDNSNFIDSAELAEVMKRLGEEGLTPKEIDEMIKVADKNKDGKINYNEFVELLCSN